MECPSINLDPRCCCGFKKNQCFYTQIGECPPRKDVLKTNIFDDILDKAPKGMLNDNCIFWVNDIMKNNLHPLLTDGKYKGIEVRFTTTQSNVMAYLTYE